MSIFTNYLTIFVYIYICIDVSRSHILEHLAHKMRAMAIGLAMVDLSSYGGQLCIMFGRIGGVTVTYCNHQQPLKLGKIIGHTFELTITNISMEKLMKTDHL